jgi:uncharacterized membrane protein SpoIIM required for sporulation
MEIFDHHNFAFYILLTFCILLCGCGIGLIINPSINQPFDFTNSPVFTMTSFQIFQTIFIKNLMATFLIISLSIFGFKTLPILCILFNGYTIGNTISLLQYNPNIIFNIIFPHGYIEFPLLIFAGACSFIIIEEIRKTGLNAYTLLTRHNNPHIKYVLKNYLFYPYILLIVPGVFIAAIIESTFSLWNLQIAIGGI